MDRIKLQGWKQGWEAGKAQGEELGKELGKMEVARSMLAMGLDVGLIAQATGLAREKIEELKNQTG